MSKGSRVPNKRTDEGQLFDGSAQTIKETSHAKTKPQNGHILRDDLRMEEYLVEQFRALVARCLVDLRKEDIGLAFAKIEEGRHTL
jgi:hypothetical protein